MITAILIIASICRVQGKIVQLSYNAETETYYVPVRVNGKELKATINLSEEDCKLSPDSASMLGIKEGERCNVETGGLGVYKGPIFCSKLTFADFYLGRKFFEGKRLIWDIPSSSVVTVAEPLPKKSGTTEFSFSKDTFKMSKTELSLPLFVRYSIVSNRHRKVVPLQITGMQTSEDGTLSILTLESQASLCRTYSVQAFPPFLGENFFGKQSVVFDFVDKK